MLKVSGISLPLWAGMQELKQVTAKKLKVSPDKIMSIRLVRKSVDARKKEEIHFSYSVEVELSCSEDKILNRLKDKNIQRTKEFIYYLPKSPKIPHQPVVVGFGPAGMFAALILAQAGQRPIVLERGACVEKRADQVKLFWNDGAFSSNSNVQFGEGGAGTFSDGKLNTGTKDPRARKVLVEFAKAGAPKEILYEAKPHIGTDRLPGAVRNIREQIKALGGEIFFETQMETLLVKEGKIYGVKAVSENKRWDIRTDHVILSIGHSARDTFEELYGIGVQMEQKPFSVGARIEHPQDLISRTQYGSAWKNPALGAADYKLSVHLKNGRGVYTFCMCPGGSVVAAASEPGGVVTNGMSNFARDGKNANSAVLVGVTPEDFGGNHPLQGVEFQRNIERAAFKLAGESYFAPAQRVEDFLKNRPSKGFGEVLPTYRPGVISSNLSSCLPHFVTESLREGILQMEHRLKGFALPDAVLTAPETRSSSPVRILRGEDLQSLTVKGLYPCGEGAGYAGGIVSAAVDGIRCAEQILTPEK